MASFSSAWTETASLVLPEGMACAVGAKADVPFARAVAFQNFCAVEKNKTQKSRQRVSAYSLSV